MAIPASAWRLERDTSARVVSALAFALPRHSSQRRKGKDIAYVGHLLRVMGFVVEVGGGEDEIIAALCHDMIEDQGGEAAARDIERRFGPRVRAIVEGCTDAWTEPKPEWRPRKEAHLKRLETADRSILLVTAADKLDNAITIVDDVVAEGWRTLARFRGGAEGTAWYLTAIYELLDRRFELGDPARVLVSRLGREAQEITQALRVAEIEREQAANT